MNNQLMEQAAFLDQWQTTFEKLVGMGASEFRQLLDNAKRAAWQCVKPNKETIEDIFSECSGFMTCGYFRAYELIAVTPDQWVKYLRLAQTCRELGSLCEQRADEILSGVLANE